MKLVNSITLALLILLSACSATGTTHMQQQTLLKLIETRQAPVIIDVRTQGEFDAGHVPGALHIPFWAAFSPDQLQQTDADQQLVLYCQHGPRAGLAKLALKMSGYHNIVYLQGHMSAWQEAKLPTRKPQ
jgi:rhodanese-related sulfurtransferase